MKYQNYIKYFLIFTLFSNDNMLANQALNIAATGMAAQEDNVNSISNNIANVNTIGFKRSRSESTDLLYNTVEMAGGRSFGEAKHSVGIQFGSGSKTTGTRKDFAQGLPKETNNPFDLMINGEGFFGVVKPNSEIRFTRDGAFNVDSSGVLVNKQGYKIYPNFQFPPNTISVQISESGKVDAYVQGQVEPTELGTIPIFKFMNAVGLTNEGGGLYRPSEASGTPIEGIGGENAHGVVMQGSLEVSNVNIMTEMTDLIKAQRAYEMNAKIMGVADQMLQTINNIR
jgi:flagellar basal-body rod protein FlgG